jgi:CrcB protein
VSVGTWVAVGVLGSLGACGRFSLDGLVERGTGLDYPLGTLVVNLTGAFVLGALAGADVGGNAYVLAGGALLGAYTTFSTWMLETCSGASRWAWRWPASATRWGRSPERAGARADAVGGALVDA